MLQDKSAVVYRQFCESDCMPLARIIGNFWYGNLPTRNALICGEAELNYHLAHTSWGYVAALKQRVVGAAFCTYQQTPHATDYINTYQKLLYTLPDEQAHQVSSVLDCGHRLMRYVDTHYGTQNVGYLQLLIVDPHAHNLGIGGSLFRYATDWLSQQGAQRFRLVTDDSCNWQFYEYKKLTRKGKLALPQTNHNTKPFYNYVYEGVL